MLTAYTTPRNSPLQTFTRWWNSWLSERQLITTDLCEDIKSGVLPNVLIAILSRSPCARYVQAPRTTFQKLDNLQVFLRELREKSIKLVNIGAEDLASGDRKLVLGLTGTLILAFEVQSSAPRSALNFDDGGADGTPKAGIAELLEWAKAKVKPHGVVLDGGWQKGFTDGQAFCALGMRAIDFPDVPATYLPLDVPSGHFPPLWRDQPPYLHVAHLCVPLQRGGVT